MAEDNPKHTLGVPKGAYLVFNQSIFPITKSITHIGRKPENDIVIQDNSVSRFHAYLRVDSGRFVLSDRNSQNGTIVNKSKVAEMLLKTGTIIYFGKAMAVFVQEDEKIDASMEVDTEELGDL